MKTISILMLAFGAIGLGSAETVLYAPNRSIADQQITVRSWGGGTVGESEETAFEGTTSIRVSAKDLFSGGEVIFSGNPDLSKEYSDKNDLLRITFKVADSSSSLGGGGTTKGPPQGAGGFGGPPKGGPPAGGGPPGGGGRIGGGGGQAGGGGAGPGAGPGAGGQAGLGGRGGPGAGGSQPKSELKKLRVVITTTDGLKSEAYVPADVKPDSNGWRQVGIPLQAITGFERTNKIVKEIAFSTDITTTVWIGDLRTIVDTTPITCESTQTDLNLAQDDQVVLSASGFGGASMLKYDWYFDTDTTGLPDAVGQAIVHRFRKPGTFTITLVISDYFGLKQPYKTSFKATVN